jgi:acyl dehydratase
MAVDREAVVGRPVGAATIHVERGPVTNFARAVTDNNPVYRDAGAAAEAGFDAIPAPPTWTFAAQAFGLFPEDQPEDPTGGSSPMAEIMGQLMANGGLILHGEQEFTYHQPVVVGQTLHHYGEVVDLYTKESGDRVMTFLVIENRFTDDDGEPVVTETFNLIHRS